MYNVTIKFKKDKTSTFENVSSIRVGDKPVSPVFNGDEMLTKGVYPSNADIAITHSAGLTVIAKNTFESITISKQ